MDTTDVVANADPAEERFTYHIFNQSLRGLLPELFGSAIRAPSDMSMWPPTVLFDAVYASAVWHHFHATNEFEKWKDVFYPPDGPMTAAKADGKRQDGQSEPDKKNKDEQNTKRKQCAESRAKKGADAMDSFDMVMMCRYMQMGPEKTRVYLKQCEEMAAAREHKGLEEKVNSWRQGVV